MELGENPRFERLKLTNSPGWSELILELVEKDAGVFLWVHLVIKYLLQGLRNGDDIEDLQRRLRLIPADYEEYFTYTMNMLDRFYLEQATQLFEVAVCAHKGLSLMAYTFIHEADPDFAVKSKVEPISVPEIYERFKVMERRLNFRCKGMLEVHHIPNTHIYFSRRVEFLHRTVGDYLQTLAIQKMLKNCKNDSFHVELVLCKSLLAQIKSLAFECSNQQPFFKLLNSIFRYAQGVERNNSQG